MDSINYDDFKNICRICLLMCEHKFVQNVVISKTYYMLMGIRFETNDQLPRQICLECFEKIIELDAFVLQCKQSHSILIKCLENYENEGLNANTQNTNEFSRHDDITIEEHKIQFVKVEENVIDELQIQCENAEETKAEINDENINSVNNECNKIEEMPQDTTNQNLYLNLNNDTNSDITDSTSIQNVSNEISDLRPKTLIVHKRKHVAKSSFECDICNKSFKQSSHLNNHKRIHSGERPYTCDICNKTFNRLDNLKIHKHNMHSGGRPYTCEICSKSFNFSCHLNQHKRIHSGERPYACETCNKTFNRLGSLNDHKRIHSGENPYVCEICNKSFNLSSNLKRHKRVCTAMKF